MPALPRALDKLASLLARLPGIGERTATRMAFQVLSEPADYARSLARALDEVVDAVGFCADCHHVAEGTYCDVCNDPGRDPTTICVLEGIPELMTFESSGAYRGRYHVLHGTLAPLRGVGPDELHLGNLRERIERQGVREVIVATSTGVEGEATALYLQRHLADLDVRVTRIATGIPMGGELEYVDPDTLERALDARRELEGD